LSDLIDNHIWNNLCIPQSGILTIGLDSYFIKAWYLNNRSKIQAGFLNAASTTVQTWRRTMRIKKYMLTLVILCSSVLQANAVPITDFFNTGVDSSGAELSTYNSVDPHYIITGGGPAYIKTGIWGADDSSSQWISKQQSGWFNGTVNFETTFSLSADAILSTVLLDFTFGHDDKGVISLNGTQLASYSGWSPGVSVSLDASSNATFLGSLLAGTNTLKFSITNYNIPGGMRITQASGSYDTPLSAVPEPTTMLLFGTGLLGLAGARRRMRN